MNRFHVHIQVKSLDESIQFYSTLFAAEPTVVKSDYAKWALEQPQVNFAISTRTGEQGLDHLGIQVGSDEELAAVAARLQKADRAIVEQKDAACCYAHSNKAWVADPSGIAWETFHTHGETTVYGDDSAIDFDQARMSAPDGNDRVSACCARPEV